MENENNYENWDRIKTNNPASFKSRFIAEDVAKILVCSVCNNFLSVRPVSIDTGTRRYFCGRCKPIVVHPLVIDYGYYALSESFLFPCQNAKYGCRTRLRYDKVNAHESQCNFKRVNCPNQLCDVTSSLAETVRHFCSSHRDSIKDGNKFHVSQNKGCLESKLLHFSRKYYVVELNSTREWFTVRITCLDPKFADFQYALTAKAVSRKNKNELETTGKASEPIRFTYLDVIQKLASHNFYFVIRIEDAKKPQAV